MTPKEKAEKIVEILDSMTKEERDMLLVGLFMNKKISFANAAKMYVLALEAQENFNKDVIAEAESIIEEDMETRTEEKPNYHIRRSMYFLNHSQRTKIHMDRLNNIFGYDEEKDKETSSVYREHKRHLMYL
jgi:selenocysteine-specific translation elongation factor